ncbi:hypothetical protein COOONC_15052 [Cooperia oncophora]
MPALNSSSSFLGRLSARSSFISSKEVKVTVQLLNDADTVTNEFKYWVDLSRPISHIVKQFKSDSLALRLRFRYYPAEPSHLERKCQQYREFCFANHIGSKPSAVRKH